MNYQPTQAKTLDELTKSVVAGKLEDTVKETKKALASGVKPYDVLMDGCKKGMDIVGDLYQNKKIFLPEVLSAARAMYGAIDVLQPLLKGGAKTGTPGTIVIGVVEGDVHDIGKNIVRILLDGMAYEVHDLGRDVPLDNFLDTAKNSKADIIACSTLMTTTLASIEDLMNALRESGMDKKLKTVIGGAATNEAFAEECGANAWGKDASDGLTKISAFIKERRG